MLRLVALVLGLFSGAPTEAPALHASASRPAHERIETLLLDAEGVDPGELRQALDLRLPGRTLARPGAAVEGAFAFVQVRPAEGELRIALVLHDGRAYYRGVPAANEGASRDVASTIANLVAGIEEDTLAPDAEDVPLPPELRPPPKLEPKPTRPRAPPPGPELGARVDGGAVIAVPPPSPSGLAGGGGALALDVRWPSGALLSGGLRFAGRPRDDLGIMRFRLSLGGGYVLRRNAFELSLQAAFDVEPVIVLRSGGREPIGRPEGEEVGTETLLGGHIRVAPGWRKTWDGRALSLRLAPFVEVGGSGLPRRDGGVARFLDPTPDTPEPVFRAGGLEVALGISIGLWARLPRSEARP